jgi:hypothetical protein
MKPHLARKPNVGLGDSNLEAANIYSRQATMLLDLMIGAN